MYLNWCTYYSTILFRMHNNKKNRKDIATGCTKSPLSEVSHYGSTVVPCHKHAPKYKAMKIECFTGWRGTMLCSVMLYSYCCYQEIWHPRPVAFTIRPTKNALFSDKEEWDPYFLVWRLSEMVSNFSFFVHEKKTHKTLRNLICKSYPSSVIRYLYYYY